MRKTEQSLIELVKRHKHIIDYILDVIVEVNAKGKFIHLSPQIGDMIGFRPEELIGLSVYQFVHPEDLSYFREGKDKGVKFEDSQFGEFRMKHKKGYYIPISVKGSLVKENGTIKIIGILRTITEYKMAEQKLEESEKKYRGILEKIKEGYFESDLNGNFTFVNDYLCKILGYTREEVLRKNYLLIYDEKTSKKLFKLFNQLFKNEISPPLVYERQLLTKSGETPYIEGLVDLIYDSEGNKEGFFGFIRDITKRKEVEQKLRESEKIMAEQKLEESEKKYRDILENMMEGYFENDLKGNFTFVNDYWCKLLESTKEEVLGKSHSFFFPEQKGKRLYKTFNKMYKNEINSPVLFETERLSSSGKLIYYEALAGLKYDSEGKKVGYFSLIRDVSERKRAEQKLKKTEKKYRDILSNIKEGYYEINLKGEYTFVNDFYCKILGFSKEELLGKTSRFTFDEKSSKIYFKMFTQLYKTGHPIPPNNIIEVLTSRGKKIFFEGSADLIYNFEGKKIGFYGLARDISERKHAEQKLKEFETKYKGILENIMEGYYEIDLRGNFTFASDFYCKVLGFSKEDILGKNATLIFDEKSIKNYNKLFAQLYKTGISFPPSNIIEVSTTRGKKISFEGSADLIYDSEGNKVGFFGLSRDVTERKYAEQKLKESEHNLKERIKELNCLYGISQFFEKPFKSVDEIIKNTLDLIPSAWQFPDLTCARIIFNNSEYQTRNFEETQWKLSASTEINKKELVIEVYYLKNKSFLEEEEHLTMDIINRLKIIIEKKQAEENLQQFISIVSHELRTPITVLVQSTEALNKYKDRLSKEKKKEMNEMISRNISLLYDLVDDLLVTSRIDEKRIKLTWRRYQPLNLILEIVELMEPRQAAREITIEVYVDKEIQLYGDNRRISQIFRILIDNAIKYSHENSKIVINTIDHYKGKYNSHGIDGILFQFKDFGVGIHEEDLPHLFQRFFRAKNVQKISGTGLGLCIAKDLIELHDGEIFVESEYGKGTTFSAFLPYLKNI